jgi:phosphatidylserine decarboxylase
MGSTVVVLLSSPRLRFAAAVENGTPVRMGQALGRFADG